jgi:hypothetical protein
MPDNTVDSKTIQLWCRGRVRKKFKVHLCIYIVAGTTSCLFSITGKFLPTNIGLVWPMLAWTIILFVQYLFVYIYKFAEVSTTQSDYESYLKKNNRNIQCSSSGNTFLTHPMQKRTAPV